MSYLSRKRRIIISCFIFIVVSQLLLIGVLGDRADKAKTYSVELSENMEDFSQRLLDKGIMLQSNELEYISETWHNWNWDSSLSWEEMFQLFTNRVLSSRIGIDGNRIVAIYSDQEDALYMSVSAKAELIEDEYFLKCDSTHLLYPSYYVTHQNDDTIYWNKIVLPTPSGKTPKMAVLYGFSQQKFFSSLNNELEESVQHAQELAVLNNVIFWLLSVMMFGMILVGMFIAINLRQAEEEVNSLQEKGGVQ